jgi:hypothetical protein
MSMSDAPIWARKLVGIDSALIEAARAFEAGDRARAAAVWRGQVLPGIAEQWPSPLATALGASLAAVLDRLDGNTAQAEASGRDAVARWRMVEPWLGEVPLSPRAGRSTSAHFRKARQDPEVYRGVVRQEHARLAGAAVAVALNNLGEALCALGRATEAVAFYGEAASLRSEAFGRREAGFGMILENLAAAERRAGFDASASVAALAIVERDSVPSGVDRYLALAPTEPELRRRLLAAAELVPILRRSAG